MSRAGGGDRTNGEQCNPAVKEMKLTSKLIDHEPISDKCFGAEGTNSQVPPGNAMQQTTGHHRAGSVALQYAWSV